MTSSGLRCNSNNPSYPAQSPMKFEEKSAFKWAVSQALKLQATSTTWAWYNYESPSKVYVRFMIRIWDRKKPGAVFATDSEGLPSRGRVSTSFFLYVQADSNELEQGRNRLLFEAGQIYAASVNPRHPLVPKALQHKVPGLKHLRWEFPKIRGPSKQDHAVLGSVLGPLFLGNSQMTLRPHLKGTWMFRGIHVSCSSCTWWRTASKTKYSAGS